MKKMLLRLMLGFILLGVFQINAHAGTFTAFGPKTFTRGSGKPITETATFSIKNLNTDYTLKIYNGGINSEYAKVSSAIVKLNGSTLFEESDFNQQASLLQKQVSVSTSNTLSVELRSSPGSGLTIVIEGEDNDSPSVAITSPDTDTYTNTSGITVSGEASDSTSWINNVTVNGTNGTLSGETFSASLNLTEGANTVTATATDAGGNTGSSSITVILDTIPPSITLDAIPSLTNNPQLTITGKIEDASPITAITINGQSVGANGYSPALFNADVTLSEGLNTIEIAATDKAGNIATASITITFISKPAPVITIQSPTNGTTVDYSPIQISGTIDDPTATVTINGNPATISNCSGGPFGPRGPAPGENPCTGGSYFYGNISVTEGANIITVLATNTAGQASTASITVYVRDITPPTIYISYPQNGSSTTLDDRPINFTVSDSYQFSNIPLTATLNDKVVTLTAHQNYYGSTYYSGDAHASLVNGANTITVTATDVAGNTASKSITVYLRGPSINITSPSHLSTVATEKIDIIGTTDGTATNITASTYYSKYSVTLSGNTFTSSGIQLYEGENNIFITASDASGNARTEYVTVYRDTTPPSITITSPTNGRSVNTNTLTLTGTTNDSTAQITINGTAATITNNTFTAQVTISEGGNTVTVTAKDSLGNTSTSSITVYLDTTPPTVTSIDPEFNETDVPLNTDITATFSEAMQSSTITSSTFTLNSNGTNISGSVTYSGSTATFTPSQNLSPETIYTATIKGGTSGVKDAVGNPLSGDYIWQFKTAPAMELTITEPQDGSVINKANAIVKGTIKAYTNDIGITVNGTIAEINGNIWTATVALTIGQNIIEVTAKDSSGNTDKKSVTINTETTDQPVTITTNPSSGIAPLTATFSIDTSISNPITSYRIDFEGNGVTDEETTDISNITHTYDTPGIYYPTVTATDSQNNTYTETTIINVLSKEQMDALLKGKWDGMKEALGNGDVAGALNYHLESSKERYQTIYSALKDQLPAIAANMNDIQLIYLKNGKAKYRIRRQEADGEFTYYIYFIMGENGLWKIYQY